MTYTPYGAAKMGAAAYGAYTGYRRNRQAQAYSNRSSFTRVQSRGKPKTGKYSSFKTKLYANQPAKHLWTADSSTNIIGMTHNTIYTCNITANLIQGTAASQRIGDSAQLISLKLNGVLSTNSALTSACQYRILVGYSGEEYGLANSFGSGLTSGELFHGSTGIAWKNTGIINPKAFTVLDDWIITLNNSIANVSEVSEVAFSVPLNTTFPYQAAASQFGKTRNLYVVVIGCVLNGLAGTTPAGSLSLSTDLIFKWSKNLNKKLNKNLRFTKK